MAKNTHVKILTWPTLPHHGWPCYTLVMHFEPILQDRPLSCLLWNLFVH